MAKPAAIAFDCVRTVDLKRPLAESPKLAKLRRCVRSDGSGVVAIAAAQRQSDTLEAMCVAHAPGLGRLSLVIPTFDGTLAKVPLPGPKRPNRHMPNIASMLKDEISRVARKEMRVEIQSLKKAASLYRSEIAALKRRTLALEQAMKRLGKSAAKTAPPATEEADSQSLRFSGKGLASQRQRLSLSAEDCGLLVGASGKSIYRWESGTARPRPSHLAAIAALRGLGKKAATSRLAALREAQ